MTIYQLKLTQQGRPKRSWYRLFEVSAEDTLYDLHLTLQSILDFDNDHLFEFSVAKKPRARQRIVYCDEEQVAFVGWGEIVRSLDTTLQQLWPLPAELRLYYLFDFGDNWLFEIQKQRKEPEPEEGVEYPRVIEAKGKDLVQYSNWEDDEEDSDE